jgi:hypothetical protein
LIFVNQEYICIQIVLYSSITKNDFIDIDLARVIGEIYVNHQKKFDDLLQKKLEHLKEENLRKAKIIAPVP